MPLRAGDTFSEPTLAFLKHAYRFVNEDWQHLQRDGSLDQGFEARFRESCASKLVGWTVSQNREMGLGLSYETASGTLHEIDLVASTQQLTAVSELKHRQGVSPDKNDVIVFFAKLIDYVAAHPSLVEGELCPAFLCPLTLELPTLSTCLGLGIHPVGPSLRPFPVLLDTVSRMEVELENGLKLSEAIRTRFEDLVPQLNSAALALEPTWLGNRCGYYSERAILVTSISGLEIMPLARRFGFLNSECSELLAEFRRSKSAMSQ